MLNFKKKRLIILIHKHYYKKLSINNFSIVGSESRINNDVQPSSAQMPSNTPQIIAVTEKTVDELKTETTTERVISTTATEMNNDMNNNNNNDEESGNLSFS